MARHHEAQESCNQTPTGAARFRYADAENRAGARLWARYACGLEAPLDAVPDGSLATQGCASAFHNCKAAYFAGQPALCAPWHLRLERTGIIRLTDTNRAVSCMQGHAPAALVALTCLYMKPSMTARLCENSSVRASCAMHGTHAVYPTFYGVTPGTAHLWVHCPFHGGQ